MSLLLVYTSGLTIDVRKSARVKFYKFSLFFPFHTFQNILSAFGIRPTCTFTPEQKNILANYYAMNKYPADADIENLSHSLGITVQQVKKWFANKRTRDKANSK